MLIDFLKDNLSIIIFIFVALALSVGFIVIINHKDTEKILSKYMDGKQAWNNEDEIREHGIGAQIIRDQGIKEMILLSKTKRTVVGLEGFDLKIVDQKSP